MTKKCKIHGEHSNWRRRKPPSNKAKGKGWRSECRFCIQERRKGKRHTKNYALIKQYAGEELAEEYANTPNARMANFLYQGKGVTLPISLFQGISKSARYRLSCLGAERLTSFLYSPTCEECGLEDSNRSFFEIHHIVPREFGGTNEEDNLIILCPNCHRRAHLEIGKRIGPFSFKKI